MPSRFVITVSTASWTPTPSNPIPLKIAQRRMVEETLAGRADRAGRARRELPRGHGSAARSNASALPAPVPGKPVRMRRPD